MYPSFVFNPRRRYDPSRRGDRSSRRGDSTPRTPGGGPNEFAAGVHSFDVIPPQQRVPSLSIMT